MAYPNQIVTLVDTVEYTNLIPGKKYTMEGTMMKEVYVNVPQEDGSIKQVLIGEHKDLKESNQTVSYTDHKQSQTGDDTPIAIFLGLLALALAGIGVIIWKKRKLNKKV